MLVRVWQAKALLNAAGHGAAPHRLRSRRRYLARGGLRPALTPASLALVNYSAPHHGYSMKKPRLAALAMSITTIAYLILAGVSVAQAQCPALPYSLTNGLSADATQ